MEKCASNIVTPRIWLEITYTTIINAPPMQASGQECVENRRSEKAMLWQLRIAKQWKCG
jgi:hypothetical protein